MQTAKYVLLALCVLLAPDVHAQEPTMPALQDLYGALSDLDDFDEEGWQSAYEILCDMAENPQNINETTIEDLQQVPLLPERQIAAILSYRSLYGDLHSISELSLITAIDRPRQILLSALFYAKPTKDNGRTALLSANDSLRQTMASTRYSYKKERIGSSLLFTMNIPTYERAGYKDGTYHGYQFSHTLRYTQNSKHYQIGLTAAQDAGEPFFADCNKKGWDFYTGYVRLKNMGALKNLVVGHYQLSLGMGLVMNNGFRLSRTSMLYTPPSFTTSLRGHSSRQESNYLQGVAATIAFPGNSLARKLALTAFASYRPLDATMTEGSNRYVTTILTTGYHRTTSEIERRNNTRQSAAGASLSMNFLPVRLALNIVHTHYRDSLAPDMSQKYRYYQARGKDFTSASLSYAYISSRLQLSGETALSSRATTPTEEKGGMAAATMNNIFWKINSSWTAFATQRFYSYRFLSPLGKSFGDVSDVQNETGIYAGATTTAIPHLALSAYVDCAYHPWYRYSYAGSSRSWDTYLLATYTKQKITASVRYRYREQALSDDGSALPAYNGSFPGTAQHTLRFSLKYNSGRWTSISQLQGTYLPTSSDWGFLLSEGIGYNISYVSLWASVSYFKTTDYGSRLYLTDHALTYGAFSTMLYGHGVYANAFVQFSLPNDISIALRCNRMQYFDRKHISSAHQLIDAAGMSDIQLQLGWKF